MEEGFKEGEEMNWHEYFIYKDGDLIWKERPRSLFKSDQQEKYFNTRCVGAVVGTPNSRGGTRQTYLMFSLNGKKYSVHRIIYEMEVGPIAEDEWVYHVDRDFKNNIVENLKLVKKSAVKRLHADRKHNTTYATGVYWSKSNRKWEARININKITHMLGYYTDFAEACQARKEAEIKYWGDE